MQAPERRHSSPSRLTAPHASPRPPPRDAVRASSARTHGTRARRTSPGSLHATALDDAFAGTELDRSDRPRVEVAALGRDGPLQRQRDAASSHAVEGEQRLGHTKQPVLVSPTPGACACPAARTRAGWAVVPDAAQCVGARPAAGRSWDRRKPVCRTSLPQSSGVPGIEERRCTSLAPTKARKVLLPVPTGRCEPVHARMTWCFEWVRREVPATRR
jgi:hypothetical protein